jgi:hypothetical protein
MKNILCNTLRHAMVPVAVIATAFGLQSMRTAPTPVVAEDKPGQLILLNTSSPVDCQMSMMVTYVDYPDADCSALYQICRFIECFDFNISDGYVFVPGAGTVLDVQLYCGSGCQGDPTTVYTCDAVCFRGLLDCCGITYNTSGGLNENGEVTVNIND